MKLEVEYYQDKPFKNWKNNPKEKDIFALLPFVRNLIEYGVDQNISHTGEDFLFLTSLLHEKQDSRRITFGDIEPLYKHYAEGIIHTLERMNERFGVDEENHKAESIALVVWDAVTGRISNTIPDINSSLRIEKYAQRIEEVYTSRYKGLPPHN